MKKIRGDEPFGVIIHIYIEISQVNSLCSYLYHKNAKMSCFSFYLLSSTKSENSSAEQDLPRSGVGTREWGEVEAKEGRWVNMVQKNAYTCMKCQNDTC
jgi:hypothetical protein